MRICIIYQGGFPPGERIEKIAGSLTGAGHEVFLLCNNYGDFDLPEEQVQKVHVIRLRPTFRSRKLNKVVKLPAFANPLWIAQLAAAVKRHRIEALHVVDIPLAVAALWIGRTFRIPVVLDMWENYPEALRIWGQTDWTTLVFKNYRLARAVELYVIKRVDHIITVVEEQKDRLIADGVTADKISVITNAVDMNLFVRTPVRNDTALDAEPQCYKLLYAGFVTSERGLDDIIRAVPMVIPKIPDLRVYIAGTGNDEPRLRKITAEQGVAKYVRFLGWIPFEDIHSYVLKSDLCLVPHVYSGFINTTIPNKLFQYMAMGKPVLVSNATPLARVATESGCGFVFESRNSADAAAKILAAYESRMDASKGERGRRYVQEKYTWPRVEPALLRIYGDGGSILSGRPG